MVTRQKEHTVLLDWPPMNAPQQCAPQPQKPQRGYSASTGYYQTCNSTGDFSPTGYPTPSATLNTINGMYIR